MLFIKRNVCEKIPNAIDLKLQHPNQDFGLIGLSFQGILFKASDGHGMSIF